MAAGSGRMKVFPVLLLLLLYHDVSGTGSRKRRRIAEPSKDFSAYTVVAPKLLYSRPKRDISSTGGISSTGNISSTSDADGRSPRHLDRLTLALEAEDSRPFVLDLVLNRQLIPENYFRKTHRQGPIFKNIFAKNGEKMGFFAPTASTVKKNDHNIAFEKNAIFFAENCRKLSLKIVIIT
jgi:hypothetical protein